MKHIMRPLFTTATIKGDLTKHRALSHWNRRAGYTLLPLEGSSADSFRVTASFSPRRSHVIQQPDFP